MILVVLGVVLMSGIVLILREKIYITLLEKKTDTILKNNFSVTEPFRYSKPLLARAGDKYFIIKHLKYWQLKQLFNLFLEYKTDDIKILEKDTRFFKALAYILTPTSSELYLDYLANYFKKNIRFSQIERIIKIIYVQNNIVELIDIYKRTVNG